MFFSKDSNSCTPKIQGSKVEFKIELTDAVPHNSDTVGSEGNVVGSEGEVVGDLQGHLKKCLENNICGSHR